MTDNENLMDFEMPDFIRDCPLVFDWCKYRGEVYFASLDYQESVRRGKPVFDLAYCATRALNNIFLKSRVWNKKRFHPWEGRSNWNHSEKI